MSNFLPCLTLSPCITFFPLRPSSFPPPSPYSLPQYPTPDLPPLNYSLTIPHTLSPCRTLTHKISLAAIHSHIILRNWSSAARGLWLYNGDVAGEYFSISAFSFLIVRKSGIVTTVQTTLHLQTLPHHHHNTPYLCVPKPTTLWRTMPHHTIPYFTVLFLIHWSISPYIDTPYLTPTNLLLLYRPSLFFLFLTVTG